MSADLSPDPLLSRVRARLRRARRRVLLHRRLLAAVLAGAAVLTGLRAAAPPPPPTAAVWTAEHDLAGGTRLRETDLVRRDLPPEAVPARSLRRVPVGRTLAAPMSRGEVLTSTRTLAPGLLAGYPGRTAVPVRVADATVAGLLRAGDPVTLVAADPDARAAPAVLAEQVPVVAVPPERGSALSPTQTGRLVVVAVPDARATEVAARALGGFLTVIWDR